jgi:hypothetical protein
MGKFIRLETLFGKFADVLGECTASIFRFEEYAEQVCNKENSEN